MYLNITSHPALVRPVAMASSELSDCIQTMGVLASMPLGPVTRERHLKLVAILAGALALLAAPKSLADGKSSGRIEIVDNVTFSANFDAGYRETQFFEAQHEVYVGQWDSRLEYWLPSAGDGLSWGPFMRVSGVIASKDPAWENGWLAGPGIGFQVYPFSSKSLKGAVGWLGEALGPLRLFVDQSRQYYWGSENTWRPRKQTRYGAEFWRARHVNDDQPFWYELWGGSWHQSANEFTSTYDTWVLGGSLRAGVRVPDAGGLSTATPYLVVESSSTRNEQYYWENRLTVGGGMRYAPLINRNGASFKWLNRLVIYAEYVKAAKYYESKAPSAIPNHDVRIGVSFSVGEWFY